MLYNMFTSGINAFPELSISFVNDEFVVGETDGVVTACIELSGAKNATESEIWIGFSVEDDDIARSKDKKIGLVF